MGKYVVSRIAFLDAEPLQCGLSYAEVTLFAGKAVLQKIASMLVLSASGVYLSASGVYVIRRISPASVLR
jgi:hypothetical protein